MIFSQWKRLVAELKKAAEARVAVVLPPKVGAWFDLNHKWNDGEMTDIAAAEKIQELRIEDRWELNWESIETHGWYVRLARYTREGGAHFLLNIHRMHTPVSEKDYRMRDRIVTNLGGDPDKDFLMRTGPDGEPDLVAFWTWPIKTATAAATGSA